MGRGEIETSPRTTGAQQQMMGESNESRTPNTASQSCLVSLPRIRGNDEMIFPLIQALTAR